MTHENVIVDGHTLDGSATKAARHVPAEPGIWILLFGDLLVFSVLFIVYLRQRSRAPELFAASQESLNRTAGALNTLVLLTSSFLVVLATLAAQRGDPQRSKVLLFAGTAVGSLFVVVKAREYHELIAAGFTPSINSFYMYFYVLTGLHLAHVALGLTLLFVLAVTTRGRPSPTRIAFVEGGACFWHMVDLLWIIIFPLIFLVR